ncbi:MAG: hypothetical protein ACREN1_01755 [Candidatus Dormibacteria bacterium]
MKNMSDQNVPGVIFLWASLVATAVMFLLANKVFGGSAWGYAVAIVIESVVLLGIIRLALGRLPLRPWAARWLGREK